MTALALVSDCRLSRQRSILQLVLILKVDQATPSALCRGNKILI